MSGRSARRERTATARLRTAAWGGVSTVLFLGLTAGGVLGQGGDRGSGIENVRLVFQLVEADGFRDEDPAIADVVTQLREVFRFQGYRLASTGLLNSHPDGEGQTRLTGGERGGYLVDVALEPVFERDSQGGPVPSDRVRIAVELFHEQEGPAMRATVSVRDGQTMVLGSTRTRDGTAIILVMRTTFR